MNNKKHTIIKFIIRYLFAVGTCLICLGLLEMLGEGYDIYSIILGMLITVILIAVDRIVQLTMTNKL